jgi:hypothetical protein
VSPAPRRTRSPLSYILSHMPSTAQSDPRFPIGEFAPPATIGPQQIHGYLATLAALPENMRSAVDGLSRVQIDTPYREGGWTIRQLLHHVADSHINAYCRTRLALTEDWPEVKAYDEKLWAELHDARVLPVEISLELLEPLHRRWVALFESLQPADWQRGYVHSENGRTTLAEAAAQYDWHCRHHVAHITRLRKSHGW